MTAYVHGQTRTRPITEADLAAARHRNSALAAELRQLDAIGEQLQAAVAETRARLEAERDNALDELNKIRAERDALASQSRAIVDYRARIALLPPPVYGGRDGLLAATAEIEAHDHPDRNGPSHGTRKRYYDGCRCAPCQDWHEGHKARAKARYRNHYAPAARQAAA